MQMRVSGWMAVAAVAMIVGNAFAWAELEDGAWDGGGPATTSAPGVIQAPYTPLGTGTVSLQYQSPVNYQGGQVVPTYSAATSQGQGGYGGLQVPQGPGPAFGPEHASLAAVNTAPMTASQLPGAANTAVPVVVNPAYISSQTNLGGPVSSQGPYTLGPDDVVLAQVRNQPEFSGVFVIGQDGMIQYGILGDIRADGLTKDELADLITERLTPYVRFPSVVVTIIGFNSKAIYILGNVASPGKYAMRGDTIKIRDALIAAGLGTQHAALNRVEVIKTDPTHPTKRTLDLKKVMFQGETAENVDLVNGDVVIVPTSGWGRVTGVLETVFGPIFKVFRWALFF